MEVKGKIYTAKKMVQDGEFHAQEDGWYYDALNMRFNSNDKNIDGGKAIERGNEILNSLLELKWDINTNGGNFSFKKKGNLVVTIPFDKEYEASKYFNTADAGVTSHASSDIKIVGLESTKDGMVMMTTCTTTANTGPQTWQMDAVWFIDDATNNIELRYVNNMGFSRYIRLQIISNFESKNIDKVYWADGVNQLRAMNLMEEGLISKRIDYFETVAAFNFSQPKVVEIINGGKHTSGMIQYAYNLYNRSGSQTKLSPMSDLTPIDKAENKGGKLNETCAKTMVVNIPVVDTQYYGLKLFAIKYTSKDQLPKISVIADIAIGGKADYEYYDDGSTIQDVTIEEFTFMGGEILIPKNIASKKTRMLMVGYSEKVYDLDVADKFRTFSFNSSGVGQICNTGKIVTSDTEVCIPIGHTMSCFTIPTTSFVPDDPTNINKTDLPFPTLDKKHSCVNTNYASYNKNASGKAGGTGEFIEYELSRSVKKYTIHIPGFNGGDGSDLTLGDLTAEETKGRFFKDGELYRIGIELYNSYGQYTLPKWIGDFVTTQDATCNLNGSYATLKIKLLPAFYVWLNNSSNFRDQDGNIDPRLKPVGYRILRADRQDKDKTIMAQGMVNGMFCSVATSDGPGGNTTDEGRHVQVHGAVKVPSVIRHFDFSSLPFSAMFSYQRLDDNVDLYDVAGNHYQLGDNIGGADDDPKYMEFGRPASTDMRCANSYQFNKLMSFYSPEIEFKKVNELPFNNIRFLGTAAESDTNLWGREVDTFTQGIRVEGKIKGGITPFFANLFDSVENIKNPATGLNDKGFFSPTGDDGSTAFNQIYREYCGSFKSSKLDYTIYGTPEIAEMGAAQKPYFNDSDLMYANTLEPLMTDKASTKKNGDDLDNNGDRAYTKSVNSWCARTGVFALGSAGTDTASRQGLENIWSGMTSSDPNAVVMAEFRVDSYMVYIGNYYGGNSYEDKKRTNYMPIGDYQTISTNSYFIKSPGDTFVGKYKFLKVFKTAQNLYDDHVNTLTEIVAFDVETSIDIHRRSDNSSGNWDDLFMPMQSNYSEYNDVYSQQNSLVYRKDLEHSFTVVTDFEYSMISSKPKNPNELVDSWTDFLLNEKMNLDGRYGPINAVKSFKDDIYTFQDRAIALLSILPRVQTVADDGNAIQLGTGQLFQDYKYITTSSGSVNKWGVIAGEKGLYYVDYLNQSLGIVAGAEVLNLSELHGMKTALKQMIDPYDASARLDQVLYGTGVSLGYDYNLKDVYITAIHSGKTLAFNEKEAGFTSFYVYNSPIYLYNKNMMICVNPSKLNEIYQFHVNAKYGYFYGVRSDSKFAFIAAPEPMVECVFNNLEYKSVAFNALGAESKYTWEVIKAYNEFQSGEKTLVERQNMRQLNRNVRLQIPRNDDSRDRVRNNYVVIELRASNTNGDSMTMGNIILYYGPGYKRYL